jgi:hypothetical protein
MRNLLQLSLCYKLYHLLCVLCGEKDHEALFSLIWWQRGPGSGLRQIQVTVLSLPVISSQTFGERLHFFKTQFLH